jgi:hypothetical protein
MENCRSKYLEAFNNQQSLITLNTVSRMLLHERISDLGRSNHDDFIDTDINRQKILIWFFLFFYIIFSAIIAVTYNNMFCVPSAVSNCMKSTSCRNWANILSRSEIAHFACRVIGLQCTVVSGP